MTAAMSPPDMSVATALIMARACFSLARNGFRADLPRHFSTDTMSIVSRFNTTVTNPCRLAFPQSKLVNPLRLRPEGA